MTSGCNVHWTSISRRLLLSFSIVRVGNHSLSNIARILGCVVLLSTYSRISSTIQSSRKRVVIRLRSSELEHLCGIKGRLPLLKKLDGLVYDGEDDGYGRTELANIFEDALLTRVVLWDGLLSSTGRH